jgi:hypothetical protein
VRFCTIIPKDRFTFKRISGRSGAFCSVAEDRKTSFTLSAAAKRKLETLKSELRYEDYAGVTEGSIVEVLVDGAKLVDLKRHFQKRQKR